MVIIVTMNPVSAVVMPVRRIGLDTLSHERNRSSTDRSNRLARTCTDLGAPRLQPDVGPQDRQLELNRFERFCPDPGVVAVGGYG